MVSTLVVMMDAWMAVGAEQRKAQRAATVIHHTHGRQAGSLRLASSAQPDRSISHGFTSGNPSIFPGHGLVVTFDHRCQALIIPAGHVPFDESSLSSPSTMYFSAGL